MSSRCKLEMLPMPIPSSLEDIESAPLSVFFALGIVNPFGPTLSFVAAVGRSEQGAMLPVVNVMLNPFSQKVEQVARFIVGETWTPIDDLAPLMRLGFGSCPTLVFVGAGIPENSRQPFVAQLFSEFDDDLIITCYSVKNNFGDPWSRVSNSMSGESIADQEDVSVTEAANRLATLVLQQQHIEPEIEAFSFAWNGSIEKSGIPDDMRARALSYKEFGDIFWGRILSGVWLPPNFLQEKSPAPPPEIEEKRYEPASPSEVRQLLHSDRWRQMRGDELLRALREAIILYATEIDQSDIPRLGEMYRHALDHTDPEHRALMMQQVTQIVEKTRLAPVAFLPTLVIDPEFQVVTTATIDFASCSSYNKDGEFYAFVEIGQLLRQGSIQNPGAVVGALISMGEERFWTFLDSVRELLTVNDVRVASTVHTPFLHHPTLQYWLRWAKQLALLRDDDSLAKFGACATALINALRYDKMGEVVDSDRHFPCAEVENPIHVKQKWQIADYALRMAPDLYWLESQEAAPKVFSFVLRAWRLTPKAALEEQYIPPPGFPEDGFHQLRTPL